MNTRRLTVIAGSLVAVAIVAFLAIAAYWQGRQPVLQNASRLVAGLQAFSRDQAAHGRALPASVTLRELVKGGYIAAADVRAFGNTEVTISLIVDETRPQDILIRARLPDGRVIAMFGDGSSQQLAR